MNHSKISTAISLLFPPTFVIFMHFYGFERVAFSYAIFMFLYLVVSLYMGHDLKSISTPLIYFVFIVVGYILNSFEFIKLIPALISASFFLFFLNAFIQKKELVLSITKKFYKNLDEKKARFIAKSDGYWAIVIFINTLIQIALVFYGNDQFWAFYSSIGWYFYMAIALVIQIVYGRYTN